MTDVRHERAMDAQSDDKTRKANMNRIVVGREVYELALDGRVLFHLGELIGGSQRKEVLVGIGFDFAEGERRDFWF